ncbi:MAG TPA: hypothetical protein VHC86_12760 [Opitutaceae bacterium]|nr:hypothetical protein [Opitutaceae bacterium]
MKHPAPRTLPQASLLRFTSLPLLLLAGALRAQQAPAPSLPPAPAGPPPPVASVPAAPATDQNKAVVLSPFEVTGSNNGFVPTSEMAGTRLGTDLKDTPVPYSVLTSQFLEAFDITSIDQAYSFFPGTFNQIDDNTDQAFSIIQNYNIRGAVPTQAQYPTVNYFPENVVADLFDVDQVEQGRGANSILFGSGPFTGNINVVTKQAITEHPIYSVTAQYGSFRSFRFTADINQPINSKAAVRVDLVSTDNGTYQIGSRKKNKGAYFNVRLDPTPTTTIHLDGEHLETWNLLPSTHINDDLSGWDGKTTFATFSPSLSIPTATRNAEGLSQYGSHYVFDPMGGTATIMNYQNVPDTQPGSAVGQFIGGAPIVGASIQGGTPFIGQNLFSDRFAKAAAGSSFFYVPGRAWNNSYTGTPTFTQNANEATLTIDQHIGDFLFFNLAGNLEKESSWGNNANGTNAEFIDVNQQLPNGQANPEFLHPYNDIRRYDEPRWVDFRNLRFAAAFTKKVGSAKVLVNILAGMQYQHTENRAYMESLPIFSSSLPDFRAIAQGGAGNADVIFYRQYWDQPNRSISDFTAPVTVFNPQTSTTATFNPINVLDISRTDNTASSHNNYKYLQSTANLTLFNDKLVLLGAVRRDFYYNITRGPLHPSEYPSNWDGRTLIFKPDAPANYLNLTYQPLTTAGVASGPVQPATTRPRTTVNGISTPQPQYANVAFQDDFNPPALHGAQNTASVGAVVNVTPWLGVYGDMGQTFALPVPLISYQNTLLPNTASRDYDGGLRFHLLHGAVEASIGAYESVQNQTPIKAIGNSDINGILNLAPVADANPGDANALGVPLLPTVIEDTASERTKGLEISVTGNLTRNWSLVASFATPRIWVWNADQGFLNYYKGHLSQFQQILTQGGLVYNASTNTYAQAPGVTYLNNSGGQVTNAINGWNALQNTDLVNAAAGSAILPLPGSVRMVASLGTVYRFDRGPLHGLSAGFSATYQGEQDLGSTAGNTIVNPANPTGAGLPVGSAYQLIYSDPTILTNGNLGYTWHLADGHTLGLKLYVTNLLNYSQPIYFVAQSGGAPGSDLASRAVNGNVSSPARIQTPNNYNFATPRSFTLTCTFTY